MINSADISGRFSLDAQSLDKLRLQSRQEPGKALETVARQFEGVFLNMLMKSMRDASPQDGMFDSDQTRFYTEMFDRQLTQKLSSGKGIGLADMMVKQMSRSAGQVVQAENIAAEGQPAAVALNQAQQPVDLRTPPPLLNRAKAQSSVELRTGSAPVQPPVDSRLSSSAADRPKELGKAQKAFVDSIWPHAANVGKALGVAPHFLVGQAALESGWGKGEIRGADGKNSHNLFNIKAGAGWHGDVVETTTTEYVDGVAQKGTARFRAYPSYAEAFNDYASLMRDNPRYAAVLENGRDVAGFAGALQRAGYATDPLYADKLTRIVNSSAMRQALVG
ncbi:MAG: flagellar assembly peptidoglycan hydrolase FlgJ [Sulfuricellaceae bacterium]